MRIKVSGSQGAICRGLTACALLLLTIGCDRMGDNPANYTSAIDSYFKAHPSCVWADDKTFPVTADLSNAKETLGYEALTDQGLLEHGAKANEYGLTKKGKSALKAVPKQAGVGNFCYGRRAVQDIDSSTPTTTDVGATTDVVYRYTIAGVPKWAKVGEVQTAFPDLGSNLAAPQLARAKLTETKKGWQVTNAPENHISTSESKLVQ